MPSPEDTREFENAQAEFNAMALTLVNIRRASLGQTPLAELPRPPSCSLCGANNAPVRAVVGGQQQHVCDGCA
jgi:hypothetical protein